MRASINDTFGNCWEQTTIHVKKSTRSGVEQSVLSTCFLQLHAHVGGRLQASPLGEGLG